VRRSPAIAAVLLLASCGGEELRFSFSSPPGLEPGQSEILLVRNGVKTDLFAFEYPVRSTEVAEIEAGRAPFIEAFVYSSPLSSFGFTQGRLEIAPEGQGGEQLPAPKSAFRASFTGSDFESWQDEAPAESELSRLQIREGPCLTIASRKAQRLANGNSLEVGVPTFLEVMDSSRALYGRFLSRVYSIRPEPFDAELISLDPEDTPTIGGLRTSSTTLLVSGRGVVLTATLSGDRLTATSVIASPTPALRWLAKGPSGEIVGLSLHGELGRVRAGQWQPIVAPALTDVRDNTECGGLAVSSRSIAAVRSSRPVVVVVRGDEVKELSYESQAFFCSIARVGERYVLGTSYGDLLELHDDDTFRELPPAPIRAAPITAVVDWDGRIVFTTKQDLFGHLVPDASAHCSMDPVTGGIIAARWERLGLLVVNSDRLALLGLEE
jgi:hypothetical protein